MRVRKFNPLLYEKLKDAQGRDYSRALRASSSYTLKKIFEKFQGETVFIAVRKGAYFASGGSLKSNLHVFFACIRVTCFFVEFHVVWSAF